MLHLQKDDNEKNDIAIIQRALQQLQSLQPWGVIYSWVYDISVSWS